MSDESESYYRVPVGHKKTISGEKREMTLGSHVLMTSMGVVAGVAGLTTGPEPLGYLGLFLTGWAANNALIAWRCERVEGDENGVES